MTIFVYQGMTRNAEIKKTLFEFCPKSGDWGKLGIPNLARMCLIKCYWMLQNVRVTAFTVSELLRENQQREENLSPPLPPLTPQIGVKRSAKQK